VATLKIVHEFNIRVSATFKNFGELGFHHYDAAMETVTITNTGRILQVEYIVHCISYNYLFLLFRMTKKAGNILVHIKLSDCSECS
jgi:hypothetical protein